MVAPRIAADHARLAREVYQLILDTITLHNFMSYGDERVDLTPINVACLTGQNGAGKSAILDAVTWGLWECARSSSDELVRLGQGEMWVEVGFRLEGQRYKVRRSRHKGGKGKTMSKGTLELQIARGDQGEYTSLTAANMRETQERISELLRMEYDTFINSVYLKQGKADEFTTRRPAERKQVLSEILGLSYFDQLQELSKEQARNLRAKAEQLEADLGGVAAIEEDLAATINALTVEQEALAEAADKVSFYQNTLDEANAQHQDMKLAQQQLEGSGRRAKELSQDVSGLHEQEQELERKLQDLGGLIERSTEIESVAREYEQMKSQVEVLDRAAIKLQDLTADRTKAQSAIASIRSRLEVDLQHWSSRAVELQKKFDGLTSSTADREKIETHYKQYRELLKVEAELAQRQETHQRLTSRADELQSKVTEARIHLDAEIQQKEITFTQLEEVLTSSQMFDEEQLELQRQSQTLDKLEAEFELIEDKGIKAKSEVESSQLQITELKRRQKEIQEKIRELQNHSDSSVCPLCSAPIVDRMAVIEKYRQEITAIDQEVTANHGRLEELEKNRNDLRKQYIELKQQLDARKQLDKRIGQFNEKVAAVERARANRDSLRTEVETLKKRLELMDFAQVERESLIGVKAELHKLEFDPVVYSNLQGQIRAQRHSEIRYQQLQRDLSDLKKLTEELPPIKTKIEELTEQLENESFAAELKEALQAVDQKIAGLDYNRDRHISLKDKLAEMIPSSDLFMNLERARSETPTLQQSLESCRQSLAAKIQQIADLELETKKLETTISNLPTVIDEIAKLQPALAEFRQKQQELASAVAVHESRRARLEAELAGLQKRREELVKLREEFEDYTYLAEAFGKKGIQAVIIENAIPEIETEANRILSRLSENQMHVAFSTQHKNKSGSVVETLDLLIGDEQGTRNYELYSGGEAFKVDFAVRIALSRLLARRAGAKLETLIIDEGFGSQDEQSRERMVRAINSIKTDFARILVVTHISEMKEMFPSQIHVTKVGGTSQVELHAC
jgi:exonuclease SbcC